MRGNGARENAAALAAAALGKAKFPLLVVRRSRRHAGFALLVGSLMFGFAVAVLWAAWRDDEPLAGPALLFAAALFYGVQAGRNFRDDSPKLTVERAGLAMPGVTETPVPWTRIAEVRLATGFRAWGGGRLDIVVDAETFALATPGQRWAGDPIVKRTGMEPAFSILAASLDTDARKIAEAIRRYWPPEDRS
jgi:hypothetical protein